MTPNFMVFVCARAVILILPEARRWGSVGSGCCGVLNRTGGLEAVWAGGVVTQNPRAGCISGVGIRPFFASGCGDGGKFCDANRPIAPRRGRRQPRRGHRSGDGREVVEDGGAAGFGWDMHLSDSRLALGREGPRFSGLSLIE